MTDVLTPEQRRLNMSRVRSKNTKPEMLLRNGLHGRGYRYCLHQPNLPGCPDLVFPRCHAVIFVHGCFWHGHGCRLFRLPETRTEFWKKKISANIDRDRNARRVLLQSGWRMLTIWECALRGSLRLGLDNVLKIAENFLRGRNKLTRVTGKGSTRVACWR